jgi:hypothetical protein
MPAATRMASARPVRDSMGPGGEVNKHAQFISSKTDAIHVSRVGRVGKARNRSRQHRSVGTTRTRSSDFLCLRAVHGPLPFRPGIDAGLSASRSCFLRPVHGPSRCRVHARGVAEAREGKPRERGWKELGCRPPAELAASPGLR